MEATPAIAVETIAGVGAKSASTATVKTTTAGDAVGVARSALAVAARKGVKGEVRTEVAINDAAGAAIDAGKEKGTTFHVPCSGSEKDSRRSDESQGVEAERDGIVESEIERATEIGDVADQQSERNHIPGIESEVGVEVRVGGDVIGHSTFLILYIVC